MDPLGDTLLDSLAAQVRAYPPLPLAAVAELLAVAHRDPDGPAQTTLVHHHLAIALDASLARQDQGLDIGDLYQEASVAVVTAVAEYTRRGGPAEKLREYVGRVVDLHLDAALAREAEARRTDEAFVADVRRLDATEAALGRRLGRPATPTELAAELHWSPERVDAVAAMLAEARAINDATLLPYLAADDLDDLVDLGELGGLDGSWYPPPT